MDMWNKQYVQRQNTIGTLNGVGSSHLGMPNTFESRYQTQQNQRNAMLGFVSIALMGAGFIYIVSKVR
jgi:hypothetical protein